MVVFKMQKIKKIDWSILIKVLLFSLINYIFCFILIPRVFFSVFMDGFPDEDFATKLVVIFNIILGIIIYLSNKKIYSFVFQIPIIFILLIIFDSPHGLYFGYDRGNFISFIPYWLEQLFFSIHTNIIQVGTALIIKIIVNIMKKIDL